MVNAGYFKGYDDIGECYIICQIKQDGELEAIDVVRSEKEVKETIKQLKKREDWYE